MQRDPNIERPNLNFAANKGRVGFQFSSSTPEEHPFSGKLPGALTTGSPRLPDRFGLHHVRARCGGDGLFGYPTRAATID